MNWLTYNTYNDNDDNEDGDYDSDDDDDDGKKRQRKMGFVCSNLHQPPNGNIIIWTYVAVAVVIVKAVHIL